MKAAGIAIALIECALIGPGSTHIASNYDNLIVSTIHLEILWEKVACPFLALHMLGTGYLTYDTLPCAGGKRGALSSCPMYVACIPHD